MEFDGQLVARIYDNLNLVASFHLAYHEALLFEKSYFIITVSTIGNSTIIVGSLLKFLTDSVQQPKMRFATQPESHEE